MIDSNFRTPYQRLIIDPLLKKEIFGTLSPQTITLWATLSGLLIPLFLYFHLPLLALLFLLLSGFFDTLDGSIARYRGIVSPKGAVLDIVSDRLVEFLVILGLFLYAPQSRGFICLWILGSAFLCVTTFLVVGIFQANDSQKSFYYSPGLIERGESFIFFIIMILYPNFFFYTALLFGFLTLLTALIRIAYFIKNN